MPFFSGPAELDQKLDCVDLEKKMICKCTIPSQTLRVVINPSKFCLIHSCYNLEVTIDTTGGDDMGRIAFLIANNLTVKQGTLKRVMLYSDAVNTVIDGFDTDNLILNSPGSNVVISDGRFVNATVVIISAENALIKDTNFTGEIKFDENRTKYWGNPFPSSTSTFTISNLKNLHLSATNFSQVLFDTGRVERIVVENNSSLYNVSDYVLWKLESLYDVKKGQGAPFKYCNDTKLFTNSVRNKF